MRIKIITAFFILGTFILSSCEKALFNDETENTPTSNFDYLWKKVDEQYAFFQEKNVDWDQVYSTYRPMVNDETSDDSLFRIMAMMLNTLNDGHVNLISPFDVSRNENVYCNMVANKNIDIDLVTLNYLGLDYHKTGALRHQAIKDGRVGYIYYPSFSDELTHDDINYVSDLYKNAEGIIFDIRQNGGGYISSLWTLLSHFTCDGRLLYHTQIKSGPGHDEFSDYETVKASKKQEYPAYTKPFIVLTDRGTYSAASFFSICTFAYPNMMMVGDTTGGGTGLPNGGQLPNGWCYRFSITRTDPLHGSTRIENGVIPDYTVILNDESTQNGKDNVIEFACYLIFDH